MIPGTERAVDFIGTTVMRSANPFAAMICLALSAITLTAIADS
jgi:hypothetical protein